MKIEVFVYGGGIFHLGWALFDSLWPKVFNWKKTLAPLDELQRSLPYILSRLLVLLYLGFAYLSFLQTEALLGSDIGRSILIFISVYWTVRTVMQIQFAGLFGKANKFVVDKSDYGFPINSDMSNQALSNVFVAVFLLGIALHLVPVLYQLS